MALPPLLRVCRSPGRTLARSHNAHRAPLAVVRGLDLKRHQFVQAGAHAVPRERRDVDEDVRCTIWRRYEAEASIVVPPGECAVSAHEGGLTPAITGAPQARAAFATLQKP
jgi:hypothetical protein